GETEREQCAQCDKLISFSHDRLLCHSIVCFKVAREAGGSVKAGASAPGERLNRVPSPWNGRQRYRTASSSERDKGGRYGMKSDRRENWIFIPLPRSRFCNSVTRSPGSQSLVLFVQDAVASRIPVIGNLQPSLHFIVDIFQ